MSTTCRNNMRLDAEVYSNTMFSLCNRFIRETLSGNAEGYKVFCIQLDKSRFCTSTLPYFQPLFHKPETASVIISSSRLSESAPCSGCWVSCPSLFSAPFSGSIFRMLLKSFFPLPIAGALLTICFGQALISDCVPFLSHLRCHYPLNRYFLKAILPDIPF